MSTSDLRAQLTAPENTGLALRDVGFSATASTFPPRARAPPKRVIDGVSCLAPAGEVVFIIGASGSGKTSVLDAIADRVASSVDGVVSLNGQVATARELKRHVKYVPQTPYLYETLTVDETLNYAASFYCPQRAVRAHRVENALVALGLASARNVKCGGVFYRGLSGGQRRRVAIAIELVARPTVLLLDEPTTGLDSTGAHAVMSHLRELATRERLAIICTIHQPPRRMLDLCDRLLLLADGRVAFSGRMTDVIPHFHSLGRELPPRTNVAEWLLNETSSDFQDDPERVAQLLDAWPKSECCSKLEQELADAIQPKPDSANEGNGTPNGRSTDDDKPESAEDNAVYKRSIAVQTALLAKRNVVEAFRNPAVIYLRLVMYLALAVVVGVAWIDLPFSADIIRDRSLALAYVTSFFIFMSIAVLPVYLNEKQIVIRERTNASYSALAYIAGHFVMEVIFIFVMSLLLSVVVYFMVGLRSGASHFFFFFLALALSLLCAESIMLVIAAIVPFLLGGIAVGAFLYGAFMVVMGGMIDLAKVPWVVRWMQYISLHTYGLAALAWNEFDGVTFAKAPNAVPPIPQDVAGVDVLNRVGWPVNDKWANIGAIIGMTLAYRVIALAWVHYKWTGKR